MATRCVCGLLSDRTVKCWGDNTYKQSATPAGLFLELAVGWIHVCGIKTDRTIACWGDNSGNQRVVPTARPFMVGSLAPRHFFRLGGLLRPCAGTYSFASGHITPGCSGPCRVETFANQLFPADGPSFCTTCTPGGMRPVLIVVALTVRLLMQVSSARLWVQTGSLAPRGDFRLRSSRARTPLRDCGAIWPVRLRDCVPLGDLETRAHSPAAIAPRSVQLAISALRPPPVAAPIHVEASRCIVRPEAPLRSW